MACQSLPAFEASGFALQFLDAEKSFFSRTLRNFNVRYYPAKTAENFLKAIKELPPLDPALAIYHKTILAIRSFKHLLSDDAKKLPSVQKCIIAYEAFQLRISVEILEKNADFREFAKSPPLERYLAGHKHTLKVSETGTILILYQNEYREWGQVRESFENMMIPEIHTAPVVEIHYDKTGVTKRNIYDWNTFEPFRIEKNHSWGAIYLAEICVCTGEEAVRYSGDHTWLRLKTPEGEIYSVGLNLPRKIEQNTEEPPFRERQGYLQSPDISEDWDCQTYTLPLIINKEQFNLIKKSIEDDKACENSGGIRLMHVLDNNCTDYTLEKVNLAGFKFTANRSITRLITPIILHKVYDGVAMVLPTKLMKIIDAIGITTINTLLRLLGRGKVDTDLSKKITDTPIEQIFPERKRNKNKEVIHKVSSVWDFFFSSQSIEFPAPTYLRDIILQINSQRENDPYFVPLKYQIPDLLKN